MKTPPGLGWWRRSWLAKMMDLQPRGLSMRERREEDQLFSSSGGSLGLGMDDRVWMPTTFTKTDRTWSDTRSGRAPVTSG
jgi:hypothetical protein